jgi:hypothetical protein
MFFSYAFRVLFSFGCIFLSKREKNMKITRKVHSNKIRNTSGVSVTNKNRCNCNNDSMEMLDTDILMKIAIYKKDEN